jgi:hypothetical protein
MFLEAGLARMNDQASDDIGPKKASPDQDGLIPPWQNMTTLCKHISCSPNMVDSWVEQGILPPPRKRGDELMWKWSEVDDYLTHGGHQAAEIDRIREATRRIVEETPKARTPMIDNEEFRTQKPHELLNDIRALVHEAATSRTLFVSDAELIRRLGVPEKIAQPVITEAEEKYGLPKKQKLWGDRRYWPAVKAWLDKTCGLESIDPRPRKNSRSKPR